MWTAYYNGRRSQFHRTELNHFVIILMALFVCTQPIHASEWKWDFSPDTAQFQGIEQEEDIGIDGTFLQLPNLFYEMQITGAERKSGPGVGTVFYSLPLAGFHIAVPPLLSKAKQMSTNVMSRKCPRRNEKYNWIFSVWGDNDVSSDDQAVFGSMSWFNRNRSMQVDAIYNVTKYSHPAWFPGPFTIDNEECVAGEVRVNGPAGTDRAGRIYFGEQGTFAFFTEAKHLMLGLPQVAIDDIGSLQGHYSAYWTRYNPHRCPKKEIRPASLSFFSGSSKARGYVLGSVKDHRGDHSYGNFRFEAQSLNTPEPGMIKASFTRSEYEGKMACSVVIGLSSKVILCAGQAEDNNQTPSNLLMVSSPPSPVPNLTCEGEGDLMTTCIISRPVELADRTLIRANNLIIAPDGALNSQGEIILELTGDLTIQQGAAINSKIDTLLARNVYVEEGGHLTPQIRALLSDVQTK